VVVHGWNSVMPVRHEEHNDLYWFGPPESKTLRPVWYWNYVESHLPPRRAPQAALYWPTTLDYKSVSIYSSRLQCGKLIRVGLSCLVLQVVFMSSGPHVRSGRAHGQVGGSSGRSGPLDRDLWDPGRWGPMGTHVSQPLHHPSHTTVRARD
jgi:hypothetical protein